MTLLGEHVVVLKHVFTDLEVTRLQLTLVGGDVAGDHLGFQRHVVGVTVRGDDLLSQTGGVGAHQIVLHGQVEATLTGVTLTATTTTQLVVDTARLVAFGAQHVQTAELHHLVVLHRDGFLGCLQGGRPGFFVLVGGVDGV